MEIKTETLAEVTVFHLSGELTGNTAPDAEAKILADPVPLKMVLDMTDVSFMSSAGLRVMLMVFRKTKKIQGQIILVGLSEHLRNTMEVTGFLEYFVTCEKVEEAVAKLKT